MCLCFKGCTKLTTLNFEKYFKPALLLIFMFLYHIQKYLAFKREIWQSAQNKALVVTEECSVRRCFSVHLQCRIGGRAGDAMRLASSTTSISSSSTISTLLLSCTTIFLLLVVAEAGTHLDEPWFRWKGGNVNYYFKVVAKSISVKSTFSVFPKIISSSWFPMFWTSKMQMVILQDMTNADRRVMRNMMRMIEQRTCLRFREQRGPLVG